MKRASLLFLVSASLWSQALLDCRTVFVEPMPEAMDRFASVKLVQWGTMQVVKDASKADCILSFPRQQSRIDLKSSGSRTVPERAEVTAENAEQPIPSGDYGLWSAKQAAFELVHRESSAIMWASSTSENWTWGSGPKALAEKLVGRLKKDCEKQASRAGKKK